MKTAISIPDEVFEQAENFARKKKISRSALYTVAVDEYVRQQEAKDVTRKLNEIYPKEESNLDAVMEKIQTLSLPKEIW